MALEICPPSRAELILEVMAVRMSAVDLEARKPYWKSLKRPFFFQMGNQICVDDGLKQLTDNAEKADGPVL